MSLNKSRGQMYVWLSHMHSHLGGQCSHLCSYCYVGSMRGGRPAKFSGSVRLLEDEFKVNYGTGKTIFMEHCNDLFAEEVPPGFIASILGHCKAWSENTYVFQTKNPGRMVHYEDVFPPKRILGVTIETNRNIGEISKAPPPEERYRAMKGLKGPKFLTVEPILEFDLDILAGWIVDIRPDFVNIGADSKGHGLPEPTSDKVKALIDLIVKSGIEIREKHNLGRLIT